jgi:hypothetical protein
MEVEDRSGKCEDNSRMSVNKVIGDRISQNPVGRTKISAHHHYIGRIILSFVRVMFIAFHIPHKWNWTNKKWRTRPLKFGGLTGRHLNIETPKSNLLCILATVRDATAHRLSLDEFAMIL